MPFLRAAAAMPPVDARAWRDATARAHREYLESVEPTAGLPGPVEMGKVMAGVALQVLRHGQPVQAPCVLISGGETTVTVRGTGRGGRNVEFLLGLAIALGGTDNIYAIAADTDGIDGIEETAGAVIGPETLAHALKFGLSAKACLESNDAHAFFETLGDQIVTGPTLTNVNDFRAILIK